MATGAPPVGAGVGRLHERGFLGDEGFCHRGGSVRFIRVVRTRILSLGEPPSNENRAETEQDSDRHRENAPEFIHKRCAEHCPKAGPCKVRGGSEGAPHAGRKPLFATRFVQAIADRAGQRAAGVGFLEKERSQPVDGFAAHVVQAVATGENGPQARLLRA